MLNLKHRCGTSIDYIRHDDGMQYEARFYHPETKSRLRICPGCDALLYRALALGELTEPPLATEERPPC